MKLKRTHRKGACVCAIGVHAACAIVLMSTSISWALSPYCTGNYPDYPLYTIDTTPYAETSPATLAASCRSYSR